MNTILDDLNAYCRNTFELRADGFVYRVRSKGVPTPPTPCAFWIDKGGYAVVTLNFGKKKRNVFLHRLAVFLRDGAWPITVDHIDGNPRNNRIGNLRACTHAQNVKNQRTFKTNKNGFPVGVCRRAVDGKFIASVQINGKTRMWAFGTLEEAIHCRQAKASEVYGAFAPSPECR